MEKFPELKGSEKQVNWANQIRDDAMKTITANLDNMKDYYEKFKDFESQMAIELYTDMGKVFSKWFSENDSAASVIDRRNLFDPENIVETVRHNSHDMYIQHCNGMVWDPDKRKMVRP